MPDETPAHVAVTDIAPGLWIWRIEHPHWRPDVDWQKVITCTVVDAGRERWVIDPLLPPDDATEVWDRFAQRAPTAVAVIIPDHLRETVTDRTMWSIDALADRYGARAFGPPTWEPGQGPPTHAIQTIRPGDELPGGVRALRDPRGWNETPLYLPEQRTIVFGDALTERDGALRVWMSPTHEDRALPDLRAMLQLPFERVIISHGEPVHTRDEFARALERPPWPASSLHIAAYNGGLERVKRRVESGADLGARDERYGKTPLEWAEMGGHADVIDYLRSMAPASSNA